MRVAMSVRTKTGSTSSDGSQLSERRPSHDREKIEGMVDSRVGSGGVHEEEGTVKAAQRPQSREAQENENKGVCACAVKRLVTIQTSHFATITCIVIAS